MTRFVWEKGESGWTEGSEGATTPVLPINGLSSLFLSGIFHPPGPLPDRRSSIFMLSYSYFT